MKMMKNMRCATVLLALAAIQACSGTTDNPPATSNNSSISSNNYQMGGAIQGIPLSLSQVVSTLAGSSQGFNDGAGAAAKFDRSLGITADGSNLFVVDYGSSTIRKVVIATGAVTTLAGTAGNRGLVDGTGAAARFNAPFSITTDGTNLFVGDTSAIRKIKIATGEVTTLAGTFNRPGSTDGIGASATFRFPYLTTDGTNLFVADVDIIRKVVIATGAVTTLAGTPGHMGSADGIGSAALFSGELREITTDGTSLFVVDSVYNTIRKIVIDTEAVSTLAGKAGTLPGSTDGTGPAARFYSPHGITSDGTNLYVADCSNNTIRKVAIATGVVTTLVGTPGVSGSADGASAQASFNVPFSITSDGKSLFVTDIGNNSIRDIY